MSGGTTPVLKELTVSCNQCGSANMVRLDRKEYRCGHCGAITVVSDDDAERLQSLLRDALGTNGSRAAADPSKTAYLSFLKITGFALLGAFVIAIFAVMFSKLFISSSPSEAQTDTGLHTQSAALEPILAIRSGALPELPAFDTSLLVTQAPRHLIDENGKNIYLGEVTNTSPNLVVLSPAVTMVLLRQGQEIDRADRSFPDLPPGLHVPIFFHYDDGASAPFDEARFLWGPVKAYPLGDSGHARFSTEVHSDLLPRGHGRKVTIEVTGLVRNLGSVSGGASVYAVLRDASGLITGYAHGDIPQIAPGAFDNVRFLVYLNGAPAVRAELLALPQGVPVQ